MTTRICPKCLDTIYSGYEQYCSACGTGVIGIVFQCECGAELYPLFGLRFFPPWGKSLNSYRRHCPNCGRDVRNLIEQQIREMQRAWRKRGRGARGANGT